jgi:alpha-beta hydrolase superfamily lysophospholipase
MTDDGVRLDSWLVPVVDASVVLVQRDDVLRNRHPAVVLVHDFGNRRQQMLPLVRPLHQAGFVVLVIGMRGSGLTGGVGSTFGLHEAMDIQAGVAMLRRRPFVNAQRIAVVGIGSGATAALLAAREDPSIAALVLDHPVRDASAVISDRLLPHEPMIAWMQPLCKWVFELAYQVDVDEVDLSRLNNVMHSRPVLMLDTPNREISTGASVIAVRDFLRSNLQKQSQGTASAR